MGKFKLFNGETVMIEDLVYVVQRMRASLARLEAHADPEVRGEAERLGREVTLIAQSFELEEPVVD